MFLVELVFGMNLIIMVGLFGSFLVRSGVKKFVYLVELLVFENGMIYLIVLLVKFIFVVVGIVIVVINVVDVIVVENFLIVILVFL